MPKLKLNINGIEDNFFTGTKLLGIMSGLKNYRFCWLINEQMNKDFRLNAELEIQLKKKGRDYFFPVYEYCENGCDIFHYIYYNQYDGEYLLPEFRHFDFLWLIKADFISDQDLIKLQYQLREIKGIQLVAEIAPGKIKSKSNLLL